MLNYSNAEFTYEPFPIGCIHNVFDRDIYEKLLREWPPLELMNYRKKNGHKYSLTEKNDKDKLHAWLSKNPTYKAFHSHISSQKFLIEIMSLLKDHGIDLGYLDATGALPKPKAFATLKSIFGKGRNKAKAPELKCRFEFSAMPVNGGSIRPHTDTPQKIVTMVFSILSPNEWDPAFGGGTQVVWPKDKKRIYNQFNNYLEFDEVDVLGEFPFLPNQAVIFVKTYDSWHCVKPMQGIGSPALRRSLTLNIEDLTARRNAAVKTDANDTM